MTKNICVYCASSNRIDSVFFRQAEELGEKLGRSGLHVVNGAGSIGLMRAVTDGALAAGGTVTGVIPEFMVKRGLCHPHLTRVVQTQTMHERKKVMADMADVFLALPGGFGTFEELLEIITWRQLRIHNKPVIILNTDGFYNPLLKMFEHAIATNFIRAEHAQLWEVALSPDDVMALLERFF